MSFPRGSQMLWWMSGERAEGRQDSEMALEQTQRRSWILWMRVPEAGDGGLGPVSISLQLCAVLFGSRQWPFWISAWGRAHLHLARLLSHV